MHSSSELEYWTKEQEGFNKLLNDDDSDGLHHKALKLHLQVHAYSLLHKQGICGAPAVQLVRALDWDIAVDSAVMALHSYYSYDRAAEPVHAESNDEDPMPIC